MEIYCSGLSLRAVTCSTAMAECMFDGPLMLLMNRTIADTIHLKGNKFVMGVKIKASARAVIKF